MVKDEIKSDFPLESKRKRSRSSSSSSSSSSSRSRQSKKSIKRRSRKSKKHSRHCCSRHRSRSPLYYHRRRYYGTREYPYMSRIIGVFGLSNVTDEAKLLEVFSRYGAIEHVQIIQDAKTGYSRGFGFIYFKEISHAVAARKESNGMMLNDRQIRVDFSITKRAHTPTPGEF